MKSAVEHIFSGTTQSISNYDSTKTLLGPLIQQRTGSNPTDKFAGPMPVGFARPMEQSTGITAGFPHVIVIAPDLHWVFLEENSAAAVTRRIILYEYTPSTSAFNWKGFINLNFVTNTGAKTIRGFRALRYLHSTGQASTTGTTVTGTGTTWVTERIAAGARIGFGSTDPTQITTWYEISAIGSDTSITLSTTPPANIANGAYVIEELRIAVALTNATTTNGGLFLVKGLNYSLFQTIGTNINEAGTVDNLRGIYWLADAGTVTNINASGLGLDDASIYTNSQQYCWVLQGTTTAQIFKYNLRASLASLTAGKSTSAFVLSTGVSATLTGSASQLNNGRIVTALHGPGSGQKSFYFATTTRIYRCLESGITSASTNFLSDNMVEIPPGSASTFAATGTMQSVDYSDALDRFIIMTNGAAGVRSYVTQYNTVSNPLDHIFLTDSKQQDQSLADTTTIPHPAILASTMSVWSEGGILYISRLTTASTTNTLYAIPLSSHWSYAAITNSRLITPSLSTSGATKLYRLYVSSSEYLGGNNIGLSPEPYRVYYRTSGISNNSGTWNSIDDARDLSGINPSNEIQFMFEFKILGTACIPNRIYALSCTYEDANTDSHYNPSATKSNAISRIFAWRQATAWGSNIPNLSIKLYNAATGALILSDTVTSSASGVWQYSTDGTTWNTWSSAADAIGNYIRYTATSLPTGISIKAVVTQ